MPFFLFHQTQLGPTNVLPCHSLSYAQYPNGQAKPSWSLHVFVQSYSMCLSWLLNVFFYLEMLYECQTKPSWSSTKTKLLLLNWNDFASCVGVVWTSVLCAAIHNHSQKLSVLVKILVRLSGNGNVCSSDLVMKWPAPQTLGRKKQFSSVDHFWNEGTLNVIELRDISE